MGEVEEFRKRMKGEGQMAVGPRPDLRVEAALRNSLLSAEKNLNIYLSMKANLDQANK